MREIGEFLRQKREEKNISLKDIQEITKIRLRYLEAIEEGDFSVIPGEVYLKGFITNYANAIGLDGQEVLQKYNDLKQIEKAAALENEPFQPSMHHSSPKAPSEGFQGVYLGIAVVLLVALILGLFVMPALKVDSPSETANLSVNTESPAPLNEPVSQQSDNNSATPIIVTATFDEDVWVKINIDGKNPYSEDGIRFNATSSKQEWKAQKELNLVVGNAGGVHLQFNGKDMGALGKVGERKEFLFQPNGKVSTP